MREIVVPRDLHGRAAARPLAVPRLLPEAGARPRAAERRAARAPRRGSQRLRGADGQRRRPRGRSRGERSTSDRRSLLAQVDGADRDAVDRLVRDRARRSRCSAPRSSSCSGGRCCGTDSWLAEAALLIACVGVLTSGVFVVRAVAHRRPRRSLPGDRGHGRGRRLRGVRADGRAHRDVARAVPVGGLPRSASSSKARSTSR